MNRAEIAQSIAARLQSNGQALMSQWQQSAPIHHCFVDDLLPEALARRIYAAYPRGETMRVRRSLRELKYVAAQMDRYDPLLEETLYAFQDPSVVRLVQEITGLRALQPDHQLYAGGISMMGRGHFLNPHLDNSHDLDRRHYRVLNLLYYVSPGWRIENGGNLELWPRGPRADAHTIESRFNRLVIMITNTKSWHSVAPIVVDERRCCVSNYYFSEFPAESAEYFHVTSFRARPNQFLRDLALRADATLRMGIRKIFPRGVVRTSHYYKKNDPDDR
jgi:Rps23 Pro-64 3,4-dihydroxylase Tpa1-like proline 4-hydroxylase